MSDTPNPSHIDPSTPSTLSRRKFLAGTAVGAPMILASGVLGAPGRPGANSRIITGHIGVGGKGISHVKMIPDSVGAICDVDALHARKTAALLDRKVPVYSDYREVLDRKDIDGVVIASPDHWHALQTIHACQAGKDVFVEKPASRFIKEGRAMVDAAEHYKRVVQVGSQGRNHPAAVALRKFIQDGKIGRITKIECWHKDNYVGGDPNKIGKPPEHLDWDMWLGPATKRAYNPDYCHRFFRRMMDIGGGQILDRGAHVFSLVSWIIGLDRTGPDRIEASGDMPETGLWNCPVNFRVAYEFDDAKLKVVWTQPGVRAGDFEFGAVYHGTEGKTIVRGGDGRVFLDEQVTAFAKANGMRHEVAKSNVPGVNEVGTRHLHNWFDCIKSRKMPAMDIETGHRVASMCLLANIAYRIERPVKWDATKERIKNDPSANLLLGDPGRGKWRLPKIG